MSAGRRRLSVIPFVVALAGSAHAQAPSPRAVPTLASLLAASQPAEWRPLDPENTLYLDLPAGRVVLELFPAMAPGHVANVKALAREGYFDGLTLNRAQDNYVAQWGDPDS